MADANILQGVIFHEDTVDDTDTIESELAAAKNKNSESILKPLETKPKSLKLKPAAHRVRL